jgi:hypothetical protein
VALAILSARVWVVARPAIESSHMPFEKVPELVRFVNSGVGIGFAVVILITLIEMGKQYYRLRRLTTNVEP